MDIRPRLKRTTKTLFAAPVAVAAIALIALPGVAAAFNWGGTLPGKTFTSDGFYANIGFELIEVSSGPQSNCIAPGEYSGGSWSFPYGWSCSTSFKQYWSWPRLNGYGMVDNPNSSTFRFGALTE